VYERNAPPIIAALAPWLAQQSGTVLEIGSGTGQHIGAFSPAFPHLTWQPSDPYGSHRASVKAWAAHLGLGNPDPLDLDAASDWFQHPKITTLSPLATILSLNVIHIAPIAVLDGILAGAGKALGPGGLVIFYGPFKINGAHIGDGNAVFDAKLRADNPAWGLRDIADIETRAQANGLTLLAVQEMPSNNRLVILQKD